MKSMPNFQAPVNTSHIETQYVRPLQEVHVPSDSRSEYEDLTPLRKYSFKSPGNAFSNGLTLTDPMQRGAGAADQLRPHGTHRQLPRQPPIGNGLNRMDNGRNDFCQPNFYDGRFPSTPPRAFLPSSIMSPYSSIEDEEPDITAVSRELRTMV